MRTLMLVYKTRSLLAGLGLLLIASSASAQSDAWTRGRALFAGEFTGVPPALTKGGCATCHSTSAKAGKTVARIAQAIADPTIGPGMQIARLQALTSGDLADIAAYLSTPRHATMSPTSRAFGDLAISFLPRPTQTFTLTSDGDSTRVGSGATGVTVSTSTVGISDTANYILNVSACTTPLAVGSSCDVAVVTFDPQSVTNTSVEATLTVPHDGFGAASGATLSGRGVLNLEITTAGPRSFTAPFTTPSTTSAPQTVTIANRLNSDLKLCLVDAATFAAPDNFDLVGRTYETPSSRCATLTAPGLSVTQNITFTPIADGPRFAQFTAQRVGTSDIQVLELQGNAGPFADVSSPGLMGTTLFTGVRQEVSAGATSPVVVTLANVGSGSLRVSSINIGLVPGAAVLEYGTTGCAAGSVIAQSGNCLLSVTFDPTGIDERRTQLRLDYSDVANSVASRRSVVIDLAGTGFVGPALEVSDHLGNVLGTGTLIDFGRQNINVRYTRQLSLRNLGSDRSLDLSSATIVPSGSGFALAAPQTGGCTALASGQPQTLGARASCLIDVRFSPLLLVPYAGQLTLESRPSDLSAATSVTRLNLSGEGLDGMPVMTWRDSAGNLASIIPIGGVTSVGTANPPRVTIRLANAGPGATALRLLNVFGLDSTSFRLDQRGAGVCRFDDAAPPLLEGASCEVVIIFQPQTAGAKSASLQLVSTGTSPQPILITAQASGPLPGGLVAAVPATVAFSATRAGAQSAPATVTIFNSGSSPAQVNGVQTDPPFAIVSTTCPGVPFMLAPQSDLPDAQAVGQRSCTVSVSFAPSAGGQATGTLRVLIEGQATPASTPLTGDGVEPADLSSGGCTLSDGASVFDPTLWALVVAALAGLAYRRRVRRVERASHIRTDQTE